MFTNIPTNSDRHTACMGCTGTTDQSITDLQKEVAKAYYENILLTWATSTDPTNRLTGTDNITVPIINLIDAAIYDSWKTAFEAKGYVVTNTGRMFTVSLA